LSYKIGFHGDVTAELEQLLKSIEKGVNGFGIHALASDTGASTASGVTEPPCYPGEPCSNGVKAGHDFIVVAVAIIAGAVAGYIGGKIAAQSQIARLKVGRD